VTTAVYVRETQVRYVMTYRKRHPERWRAQRAVTGAIRNGSIPSAKTLSCFDCGKQARDYDHHLGYDWARRYDVQPVCRRCHIERGLARGSFRNANS
jgi:hypothetical protein